MVTDPKNRPLKDVTVAWTVRDPNGELSAGTSNDDDLDRRRWRGRSAIHLQTVTATVSQIAGERVVFQGKNAVTSTSGSVSATSAPIAFSATRTTAKVRSSRRRIAPHRARSPRRMPEVSARPTCAPCRTSRALAAADRAHRSRVHRCSARRRRRLVRYRREPRRPAAPVARGVARSQWSAWRCARKSRRQLWRRA